MNNIIVKKIISEFNTPYKSNKEIYEITKKQRKKIKESKQFVDIMRKILNEKHNKII